MSGRLTARAIAVFSAFFVGAFCIGAFSVGVALAGASSPAVATAPRTTTDPAAAAAGWLVQQFSNAANQRVPGGDHIELSFNDGTKDVFFFDGGGTADATFALAATRSGHDKIDTAVAYLGAHLDEYVDYTGAQGGPFYGSIGKAAVAAIVDGADPNNFGGHHLLAELKQNECATGSTTCTPGSNANVFSSVSTSFIVLAEARAGGAFAPSANLLNFLLGEQCADGGFSSAIPAGIGSACAPDVDATGYAVMAMQAVGGHSVAIGKAADWLVSTRGSNGAWSDSGKPNIDSTGLAAAALVIAGRSSASSRAWLATQQVTTGPTIGTGSRRGALKFQGAYDANQSIKGTSDGVLGLVQGTSLATLRATGATPGTAVLALARPIVAHSSVREGAAQTVTGTGFSAGERVTAMLNSSAVGASSASANGTVTLHFTVPTSVAAGSRTVTLTGVSSRLSSSVGFTVAGATASSPPPSSAAPTSSVPPLADTGRDGRQTSFQLLLAAGLLAVGSAGVLLGRRPSRHRRARRAR